MLLAGCVMYGSSSLFFFFKVDSFLLFNFIFSFFSCILAPGVRANLSKSGLSLSSASVA